MGGQVVMLQLRLSGDAKIWVGICPPYLPAPLYEPERGVTGYQKLSGQVVMQRATFVWWCLPFCQNLGGELPTLPTHQLHPCITKLPKPQKFNKTSCCIVTLILPNIWLTRFFLLPKNLTGHEHFKLCSCII